MSSKKRKTNEEEIRKQLKNINVELKDGVFIFTGPLTINEFSSSIKKTVNEIVTYFFIKGIMHNINHVLSEEEIVELCLEYDYDFQKKENINASNFMDTVSIKDKKSDLISRAPIITIMGHVDHGKTTLIDNIRKSNIVATESGGITQHTAAYQIEYKKKNITFLDTPGHEAFSEMRSRGAKLTDIVVLVVAADDGVMPQTKEAIAHTHEAKLPLIVFINKMDKPNANPKKVKNELSKEGLVVEEYGGDVQIVQGSAINGKGINELFEAILLQSEMLELKANPNRLAIGVVVESHIETGRGVVTSIIVKNGTMYKKDFIVAGSNYGRIKQLLNSNGKSVDKIIPGEPSIITGLNYSPEAGEKFFGFKDEKFAKELANEKLFLDRTMELKKRQTIQNEDGKKILKVIIKADAFGTTEALKSAISKLENDEVKCHIVSATVGSITKSDIMLAQTSQSIIFAFNIKLTNEMKKLAKELEVTIKDSNIIYQLVDYAKRELKGMKAPVYEEKVTGKAKILKIINSSKIGSIGGSSMISGFINSKSLIRLYRNSKLIHEGKLDGLQNGPNQVSKIESPSEFGFHIKKFDDIKANDTLEGYEMIEVKE